MSSLEVNKLSGDTFLAQKLVLIIKHRRNSNSLNILSESGEALHNTVQLF